MKSISNNPQQGQYAGRRVALFCAALTFASGITTAQAAPSMVDPALDVRTVVSGLVQPTSMAFLGADDFLVIEKASGRVKRVTGGVVQPAPVLDLAVNSNSERGLLGIALHADFPAKPYVYLYWTESNTGVDTGVATAVDLLGNRVDRYIWDGSTLTFDMNIIRLHAFQSDAPQAPAGNHNGGVLRFSQNKPFTPDKKLYIVIGDNGRRGWMQNLPCGPVQYPQTGGPGCPNPAFPNPGPMVADDQFGGPMPDDAHLTGVVLRLNDDGTAPADNPFFAAGATFGGAVGANLQKVFAYGIRNTFGMAFDPVLGDLWMEQNGDDSFSELNHVIPGMNSGWVQFQGPVGRINQFKTIETTMVPVPPDPRAPGGYFGLQQTRWPPTNVADTPAEGLGRLFMLPGATYTDPEFSWAYEIAPAAIGFVKGNGLGAQYKNDLITGAARVFLNGGQLFRFKLTADRKNFVFTDPRLADKVADNVSKYDITESESLLFGINFGIGTDIQTGPNGNVFVVSNSDGAVYEIFRR